MIEVSARCGAKLERNAQAPWSVAVGQEAAIRCKCERPSLSGEIRTSDEAAAHGKHEQESGLFGPNESRNIELSASAQGPKQLLRSPRNKTTKEITLWLQVNKYDSMLVETNHCYELI